MRGAYQVLSDCPRCRVEAALVELMDPSERVSVALTSRCRLCGYATELGDVTDLGRPFVDAEEVREALAAWAAEEREPSVAVFTQANFSGRTPEEVARAVLAGERVTTSFDVIAFLFPGGGGVGHADGAPVPPPRTVAAPEPSVAPPLPPAVARALASVMLADGSIRPAERRFLEAAVSRLGEAPIADTELRVWRPHELEPPARPKELLSAMRALALCDKEADGSELRVLKEYGRAWQVEVDERAFSATNPMQALGRALLALFVV